MSLGSLKPVAPFSASTPTTVNSVPLDGDLLADRVDGAEQLLGDGLPITTTLRPGRHVVLR